MNKQEKVEKIKQIVRETKETVMCEQSLREIKEKLVNDFRHKLHNTVLKAIGMEKYWSEYSIMPHSPLRSKVEAVAKESIEEIKFETIVLTDKELKAVNKIYRASYMENLKELARKRGCELAQKEFEIFEADMLNSENQE